MELQTNRYADFRHTNLGMPKSIILSKTETTVNTIPLF